MAKTLRKKSRVRIAAPAGGVVPGEIVSYVAGKAGIYDGLDSADEGDTIELETAEVASCAAASALTGAIGDAVAYDATADEIVATGTVGAVEGMKLAKAKANGETTAEVMFADPAA